MKRVVLIVVAVFTCSAVFGQSTESDLAKAIRSLDESQKAILKELQEIRKLIAQQGTGRPAADTLPTAPIDIAKDPFKGTPNAKVALIEYSEFQCPFCNRFFKDTYPQLAKEYVDTGKVKYIWRDLPLDYHKQAFKAAEAAHCAGEQGKFWDMHDHLFENQKNLLPEDLAKYAETLQLNKPLFQQCLDSGRHAEAIRKDMADAGNAGITGTPSFLIGTVQPNGTVKVTRKLVGARPYADFKTALDALLNPTPPAAGTN